MTAIGGPCDSNAWIPDAIERVIDDLTAAGYSDAIAHYIGAEADFQRGCFVYGGLMAETTYLVQTVHERIGAIAADVEVTTTHWRWGVAGSSPGPTDFAIVESRLDDFWNGIRAQRALEVVVREHRWYALPAVGPNPAIRVVPRDIAGLSTAAVLPPQVACTVTLMTDVRRRWGRFYIGGLTTAGLAVASGRLSDTVANIISGAAGDAFENSNANWRIQVWSSTLSPASLPVRSVRVDNVYDVQRRRRYDLATYRNTVSLDA